MLKDRTIQAKTFTCQYIKKEDRLLLTINYKDVTTRIDFWITRSFLLKLLPYFFDYVILPMEPELQQNLESNGSTSPTDNSTFVLTQKMPVLLDSVDFTKLKNNNVKIALKNLDKNIYCVSVMDQKSLEQFIKLITSAAPAMEWGTYSI